MPWRIERAQERRSPISWKRREISLDEISRSRLKSLTNVSFAPPLLRFSEFKAHSWKKTSVFLLFGSNYFHRVYRIKSLSGLVFSVSNVEGIIVASATDKTQGLRGSDHRK